MDECMTLKINPETKDFIFDENGIMETVSGADVIAQNVQICLTAWKGDFAELPEHGTDYQKIFGKNTSTEEIEETIRDAIYQEKEVEQIEGQKIIKNENGKSKINFIARLNDGSKVGTEVLV
jgi:hypothetical protein